LVRHNYGPEGWTFPGGKIKKGEDPSVAACREIEEELGLQINPVFIKEYTEKDRRAWPTGSRILAYAASADGQKVQIDEIEIKEAKWFNARQMPLVSPFTKEILKEWQNNGELSKGQ
jgi:ADP-ribose pyrophosphatase YjhB (NUDIX family)